MRRALCLLVCAASLALAGCTSAADDTPDFQPSPTGPGVEGSAGVHLQPIVPLPSGAGGSPTRPAPSGSSSSAASVDPLVVATKLATPVGLSLLPDGTALVGERTTGRIVRVQPRAGRPVPTVRTLHGLDTTGDGGLLDLAVSPHYAEDDLIYAYITTPKDNRVVDFTLTGPVTPVLTGIPKGRSDNQGRLTFAADGSLYVGTGDSGRPALASRASSRAGKVLRITDIGLPARGNPRASSPVYTSGQHVVNGLCALPGSANAFEVESGADGAPDEVNLLEAGADYGWPVPGATSRAAVASPPAAYGSPGGCAVLGGRIWVTSLAGHALLSAPLHATATTLRLGNFAPVLRNVYGRLRTVVAAADGALWLTTSNRDGSGTPVRYDERVIRYVPSADDGGGRTT